MNTYSMKLGRTIIYMNNRHLFQKNKQKENRMLKNRLARHQLRLRIHKFIRKRIRTSHKILIQ